jgi:hypothetical protein
MDAGLYRKKTVWWLHPSAIVFVFLLPVYLGIWFAAVRTQGGLSTSKSLFFLKDEIAWLGLVGLLVLGFGTLLPLRPKRALRGHRLSRRSLTAIGVLALLGYAYWFREFLIDPRMIWTAIGNSQSFSYAVRESLDKQAGVASLAQLGLAYIIGYGYMRWGRPDTEAPTRVQHLLFWLIIFAIAFRTFAWAERVAMVEAVLALVFVWSSFRSQGRSRSSTFVKFLPLVVVSVTLLLFAIGEYFRSWISFYAAREESFFVFITQRFTNYYFDALNTGAGRLSVLKWPTYEFQNVLQWMHKLPVLGPVFSKLVDARPDDFLFYYGDPEFNNPSGLFSIFYDVGLGWGIAWLLTVGALAKYFYFYWRRGASFVGSFYFLFLMTFLELYRYVYIGNARFFMVTVGLLILLHTSKKARSG